MKQLKLYARQEPTTDAIIKKYAPKANKKDTVFYKDKGAKIHYARWRLFQVTPNVRHAPRLPLQCQIVLRGIKPDGR